MPTLHEAHPTDARPSRFGLRPRAAALALVCGALLAGGADAQARRPSWNCLSTPNAAQAIHRGKMVAVTDPAGWHVYSAATRRWNTLPNPPFAPHSTRITNDLVLFEGAPLFFACASHPATASGFELLVSGPSGRLLNPPGNRNDSIWVVSDDETIHTFSGFIGRWHSQRFPPSAQVTVKRDVALAADGNRLWGMSAAKGTWVPFTAHGQVRGLLADGTVGVAESDDHVYAFSAVRGTWSSAPKIPGQGAPVLDKFVVTWTGDQGALGYGPDSGRFEVVHTATRPNAHTSDHFAWLDGAGTGLWFFSPVTGHWDHFPAAAGASVLTDSGAALISVGSTRVGWSATRGGFATLPAAAGPGLTASAVVVAVADANGGPWWLYSALTGSWHRAPAEHTGGPGIPPELSRSSALVLDPHTATAWAFDARHGSWVPTGTAAQVAGRVDPNTAVLAIEEPSRLQFYDPRLAVWLEQATGGPLDAAQIWRTTFVGSRGATLIGHGVLLGEPETAITPSGLAPSGIFASSEVCLAIDQGALCAFSAIPEVVTPAQYPEFRRIGAAPGAPLHVSVFGSQATAAPAPVAVVAAAPAAATAIATPLGDWRLNPQAMVVFPLFALDGAGRGDLEIPIPPLPGLSGLELGLQMAVAEPQSPAWLSRMATFRIP